MSKLKYEKARACLSLAAFPGLRHEKAIEYAHGKTHEEPLFGRLSTEHIQLVPQNHGLISEELCKVLVAGYPETRFRLHANVRVLPEFVVADLSGFETHRVWFNQAAKLSRTLGAGGYTAHAGARREATMEQMLESTRRAADLFGCPVGVEGHYPTKTDAYLVSSWAEYQQVFESGVPYAIDLSHLNIVACASGVQERTLVAEMLACERCIEVHVSDNDGSGDQHRVCESEPWWADLLVHINQTAVVFSEGNHRRRITT